MNDYSKIDLHMHSTVSDGTDSPSEIISAVKKEGIELFSLTDHDASAGCTEIAEVLQKMKGKRPYFIFGAEFSCKDELGKYHILAYGYNPDSREIQSLVDKAHALRMNKVHARLDFLKEQFGFDFSKEDLKQLLSLNNPGKPHIGNLMVKYGYAKTKEEAIGEFINKKRFKSEYLNPKEAIEGIMLGGGIPVLAHAPYGNGEDLVLGEELAERIDRLVNLGIKGLECYYSGYSQKMQDTMIAFAQKYNSYVTAGSDYHGTNKLVLLGDNNLENPTEWPAGLERFLNDVKIF